MMKGKHKTSVLVVTFLFISILLQQRACGFNGTREGWREVYYMLEIKTHVPLGKYNAGSILWNNRILQGKKKKSV